MSTLKTTANHGAVRSFLERRLSLQVRELLPIHGGQIALAFEVTTDTSPFIFRLGPSINNFTKDQAAHERYNSRDLSIPRIIQIGEYNEDLFFALSEKAQGERVDQLDCAGKMALMPSIIDTLTTIHSAQLPNEGGFGFWTKESFPASKTWAEFLRSSTEIPTGSTVGGAFNIANWREQFINLCETLPNIRCLVHGDFSYDNSFANENKISAVIDWAESMFGDPLYDVAWLTFWYSDESFLRNYLNTPKGAEIAGDTVEERMKCYLLRIGLRSLSHFERSNQTTAYDWTVQRINEALS